MKKARALLRRVCDAVVGRTSAKLIQQFVEPLERRTYFDINPMMVRDTNPGSGSAYISGTIPGPQFLEFNGALYFTTANAIWKSDGSPKGTEKLIGVAGTDLTAVGSTLFFQAPHSGGGTDLWETDGTPANTKVVASFSTIGAMTEFQNDLYFTGNNGSTTGVWKSDGTATGTSVVETTVLPYQLAVSNESLYFSGFSGTTYGLWKIDGTTGSITVVENSGVPTSLCASRENVFFVRSGNLWVTDGTSVTDLASPSDILSMDGSISSLTDVNGTLFFTVLPDPLYDDDPTDGGGARLWKSNGTVDGTQEVDDDNYTAMNSAPMHLTNVNGELYYTVDAGDKTDDVDAYYGYSLWKTNGTDDGTVLVSNSIPGDSDNFVSNLTNVDGTLYFEAPDSNNGVEIWKSDGTSDGTQQIADIDPGADSSNPFAMTNIGGSLVFTGDDGVHGVEPWLYTPPAVLQAAADGAGTIDLTYNTRFGEQLELEVKGPDDSNYRLVTDFTADPAFGQHTFSLTGLQSSSHYFFRIKSVENGQVQYGTASAYTTSASSSGTMAATVPLAAPAHLTVVPTVVSGEAEAQLVWDNTSDDETGYTIRRLDESQAGSTWTDAGTTAADVTNFVDDPPTDTDVYQYEVVATYSGGDSAPSNVALTWFAPLVSAISTNPASGTESAPLTLSVTATASGDVPTSLSYHWSLANGSTTVTATTSVPSYTFTPSSSGTWTASVTVTDPTLSLSTTNDAKNIVVASGSSERVNGPSSPWF